MKSQTQDAELISAEAVTSELNASLSSIAQTAALKIAARAAVGTAALLSREEAALALNLAPATLEAWASTGKGPRFTKLGRSVGYTVLDLQKYVVRQREETSAGAE
jgi:hypothetical protein